MFLNLSIWYALSGTLVIHDYLGMIEEHGPKNVTHCIKSEPMKSDKDVVKFMMIYCPLQGDYDNGIYIHPIKENGQEKEANKRIISYTVWMEKEDGSHWNETWTVVKVGLAISSGKWQWFDGQVPEDVIREDGSIKIAYKLEIFDWKEPKVQEEQKEEEKKNIKRKKKKEEEGYETGEGDI